MKRYQAYKDSGVDWLGKVPNHWKIQRLRNVAAVQSGSTPKDNPDFWDGDIPWITPSDIGKIKQQKYISSTSRTITIDGLNSCGCAVHPEKSVVLTNRGPIGNVIIPLMEFATNQGCKTLIPIDYNHLFLYYQLFVSGDVLNSMGQGTTFLELSTTALKEFKIVEPPLPEQTQIVAYLDAKTAAIDDLIRKKEQKIAQLKEYRSALINRAVTKGLDPTVPMKDSGVEWIGEIPRHWETPLLSYLIAGIKDGTHGTHERTEDGEMLLSSKNVSDKGIVIGDNESRISKEEHESITKNGYPKKDDVLITIVGSIGRSCVYEFDYPISFQRSVCFVRTKDILNSYFLNYYFKSDCSQYELVMNTKTSTQGGIYINDIKRLTLVLPPLPEQQQIVAYLDEQTAEIDAAMELEQQKIALLKEYRQSLISSVVTGKIKVTDS
jgi:type I restriction enzyme S subunit